MKSFKNLKMDGGNTLIFENLSCLECLLVMIRVKRLGWKVESIGCWGCNGKVYKFHTFEHFCLHRLMDTQDWNFHAYSEILATYQEEVLRLVPECLPVFDLEITRDFDPDMRWFTEMAVNTLRKHQG